MRYHLMGDLGMGKMKGAVHDRGREREVEQAIPRMDVAVVDDWCAFHLVVQWG
jgi:hypothetical protein